MSVLRLKSSCTLPPEPKPGSSAPSPARAVRALARSRSAAPTAASRRALEPALWNGRTRTSNGWLRLMTVLFRRLRAKRCVGLARRPALPTDLGVDHIEPRSTVPISQWETRHRSVSRNSDRLQSLPRHLLLDAQAPVIGIDPVAVAGRQVLAALRAEELPDVDGQV